jgi:predicted metal-dependent enzyme (double-stranded beta helix superfamily)
MSERAVLRQKEIDAAVADVRAIEARHGVTRDSLEKMKQRLIRLAARTDLFAASDFPPPQPGGKRNSCLYRVSEDEDHRFALYVNSSFGNYGTPAHNHKPSWAVIVGVSGEELNRFYDRDASGVQQKGEHLVKQGTGVCFMPEDLLEQLAHREYFDAKAGAWKIFPPHSDIREARESVRTS